PRQDRRHRLTAGSMPARRSSMTTGARSAAVRGDADLQRVVCRRGEILPVRGLGARGRRRTRARSDAAMWVWSRVWLLARGCRRADLLQADLGVAVRDPALFVVAGRAAAVRDENLLEP